MSDDAASGEPGLAFGASGTATETQGGARSAEASQHFGDVDALAAYLEAFGGGALGLAGGPRIEVERTLGQQIAGESKYVGRGGVRWDHGRVAGGLFSALKKM